MNTRDNRVSQKDPLAFLTGYGLALASTTLAALARWMLPWALAPAPYLGFYPAVVVSAALGGMGPGLVATFASLLLVNFVFGHFNVHDHGAMARQVIWVIASIGVSLLAGMQRAARNRERGQAEELHRWNAELEMRIQERSKELQEANESLEQRVAGRTDELQAANTKLLDSRRATLNMMEDAAIARRAALNMMEDAVIAHRQAEESNAELLREATERTRAEAAVRQSEERYRSLFTTMMEGFCIIEVLFDVDDHPVDYRFLECNPAFEAQTGLRNAQGKLMRELAPDHEAFWFEMYGKVALTGEPVRFVNEAKALNRWYDVSAYRVGGLDSRRVAILFNDITERKRAENVTHARLQMSTTAADLSLDEILQMALDAIETQTGSGIGFYHFLEADQETLSLQAWSSNTLGTICTAEGKGSHYPVSQAGVWVDCVHERRPVIHNDYAALPHKKGMPQGHAQIVREMLIPIVRKDRIMAIIGVGNKPTEYNTTDIEIASLLGDFSWEIVERKRAEEELQQAHNELELRVRERTEELALSIKLLQDEIGVRERAEESLLRLNRLYAVLSETDQAIARLDDRDTLFREFCRIAVEEGGFLLSWVGLVDEGTGLVQMIAASGATGYLDDIRITAKDEPTGEGPTGISIREGTYYICNDFLNDPCTRPWHERGRAHGIQASASIALKQDGRVIGALTLYSGEKDFFDSTQERLLVQLGDEISFALNSFDQTSRRREAELALQKETLERLRALEEVREKDRMLLQQSRQAAMGEMVGNIAHQWRQPLNVLGLILQELPITCDMDGFTRETLDASVAKGLQVIDHMSMTIDGFRDFFRPDKEMVSFSPFDVAARTAALVDASFRELQIGVEITGANDIFIKGFPNEYSQVILNILMNARDAFQERSPAGPRTIRVSLTRENERSVLTIADNAGGIPGDILEKIFDPYFTTKDPDRGTGLGLFMSKTIIEKNMNGRLSACNAGEGATFRIEV